MDIDQYIFLFIQQKTQEMDGFKEYIETLKISSKPLSEDEWEIMYSNWALQRDGSSCQLPKIYLNED